MSKSTTNTLTLILASLGCLVAIVLLYEHRHPAANIGCQAVGGNCTLTMDSDYGHLNTPFGQIPTAVFGLGMYATVAALCFRRGKLLIVQQAQIRCEMADSFQDVTDKEKEQALSELGVLPEGTGSDTAPGDDVEQPTADAAHDVQPSQTTVTAIDAGTSPYVGDPATVKSLRILDFAIWGIALSALGISWWLQYAAFYVIISFCPWCFLSACLVTAIFALSTRDALFYGRKLTGEQKMLAGTIAFLGVMFACMGMPSVLEQWAKMHPKGMDTIIWDPRLYNTIVTKDMPITGSPTAPYLIVEFADYQCPHCQKASVLLREALKSNPIKFRLAYRNYPLAGHEWSEQAAWAAGAAGRQGKFWEMHDYIFDHQADMDGKTFTLDSFNAYAEILGLKRDKFMDDMNSPEIKGSVENDRATARDVIRVSMTPTFFVVLPSKQIWRLVGVPELQSALAHSENQVWHDPVRK